MGHMEAYPTALRPLASGHALLSVCCALYLAWWCVFFRPRPSRPQGVEYGVGVALILGAVAFGLLAVVRIAGALGALPNRVPGAALWPCAVAAYVVLALVTSQLMGRPVTTELLLIVAWTALEVSVAGAVAAAGEQGLATTALVLAVLACAGSLACYLAYYHLAAWPAFLDGCGPLVAIGVYSAVFAALV